jgi:hypothetical protein
VSDLPEVLDLLRSNFLIEDVLLFLLPDDVLHVTALTVANEVALEAFREERSKIGVLGQTSLLVRRSCESHETTWSAESTPHGHDVAITHFDAVRLISIRLTDTVASIL